MSEIRIEGKDAILGQIFGHLYLVFVDDDGAEYVIRGGPDPTSIEYGFFGNIVIQTGFLEDSGDRRTLPDGTVETREQRANYGDRITVTV